MFVRSFMASLGLVSSLSLFLSLHLQAPEGEAQPMTEVDLFISTQRIKVLNADSQVLHHTRLGFLHLFTKSEQNTRADITMS